jgi:hypothetical protein
MPVTKIAPMREGQVLEEMRKYEERISRTLRNIAELEDIVRRADMAFHELSKNRGKLSCLMAEYQELAAKGAESWAG